LAPTIYVYIVYSSIGCTMCSAYNCLRV
jgi:hypothetical protein